ncbi:hypothetical protein COCSADRAFT_345271 [Bipolaris sorokiniana ND90Pr]|uniref:Altered inheritance of mitochondria protein 9, mitochondrial n=1 Tax=Cochliobolus sativus (strain ND90Pr / ATCC 201652) TaxID=665912 RepID=M2SWD3_COCSN|nr:uncharacterized protein COCSADRAFT_345271 [Bipolaris sorokiniana ND90Pr]EMD61142.1 hypothetical protein COCSADRAFT_345271 [Bipolaris sorokiniana ND90Pr]
MLLSRSVSNIAKWGHLRLLQTLEGSRARTPHIQTDANPPFCYTSERWLWNEREQLGARYRRFDVLGLQQAACNYNKAYCLEMEDRRKVIAKVPHPNAGPRVITTSSEVATMDFARTILKIPGNGIPGCEPAIITSGPQEVVSQAESTYCIGPITRKEFWEKERSNMECQGPLMVGTSSAKYLEAIARREIDWINAHANLHEKTMATWRYTSLKQKSPEAHIALLQKFLAAIPYITPQDPELVSPRLWHPDFHTGNIYIENQAQISCIIDWQGAWTTSVKLRYQVLQSILIHACETTTAEKNPLMYKAMRHPQGQTLKHLEAFAGSTWDDCLFSFEEYLISVERCQHHEEFGAFSKCQEFRRALKGILTDEGYTSNESFSTAVEILKDLRQVSLDKLNGKERCSFEEETRWIADLDRHDE